MTVDLARLTNPWLRDFPPPTATEVEKYAIGTNIPQFAALAEYSKRTRVSMGPAKMLFDALAEIERLDRAAAKTTPTPPASE
jgi:hypothetical protein